MPASSAELGEAGGAGADDGAATGGGAATPVGGPAERIDHKQHTHTAET